MNRLDGVTDPAQRRHLLDSTWMKAEHCTCRTTPEGVRWYVCRHEGCSRPGKACGGYCPPCFARLGDEALLSPPVRLGRELVRASKFWFPEVHERGPEATVLHFALGIGGEAGEVLDVIKKADICGLVDSCTRHADGKHSIEALTGEVGDLLTYIYELCAVLDIDPDAAVAAGQAKCAGRWGTPPPRPPAPADYRKQALR